MRCMITSTKLDKYYKYTTKDFMDEYHKDLEPYKLSSKPHGKNTEFFIDIESIVELAELSDIVGEMVITSRYSMAYQNLMTLIEIYDDYRE